MGKYLLFSGAVPWNTRWQCLITTLTIVIALFVTVRKWFPFGAEWLAMVSIIAVGAVVADIARQEAPVHSTGAVVVTGASSGIGRGAAIALAAEGFTVWAGVRKESDAEALRATAASLPKGKGSLQPLLIDVAKLETVTKAVGKVAAAGQPLIALVNNAGVADCLPIEICGEDKWRKTFDVNVFGWVHPYPCLSWRNPVSGFPHKTLYALKVIKSSRLRQHHGIPENVLTVGPLNRLVSTTRQFLPLLREANGRVINIGSFVGSFGSSPNSAPYSSSKHAVEAISDSMRCEFTFQGVTTSLIKPGAIRTALFDKLSPTDATTVTEEEVATKLAEGCGDNATNAIYQPMIEQWLTAVKMMARASWLADPSLTSVAIVHATTSPFPKSRYLVGLDAILVTNLLYILPTQVVDRVVQVFLWKKQ